MEGTLAIIGTGRMGEALLRGLLGSGQLDPDRVICTDAIEQRCDQLRDAYGVRVTSDNRAAIEAADVVLIALKPQVLLATITSTRDAFRPGQTVISVAAGITIAALEAAVGDGVAVVRVMSNTPAQVDAGMSAVAAGTSAGERELALAEALLAPVGRVIRTKEADLDAVTALSGSGPAYIFLVAEAMTEAGVLLGLSRDVATELVVQTILGSATMLRESEQSAAELREAVTSPAGTTGAALHVLEQAGLRAAFLDAIEAAKLRSEELGRRG